MSVRIFIGPNKKLDATNGYEMLFTFSIHERKPSRNCGTWPVVVSASEPKFRRGANKGPTSVRSRQDAGATEVMRIIQTNSAATPAAIKVPSKFTASLFNT